MKILTLALCISLTGCASIELSQAGRGVQLHSQLPTLKSGEFIAIGDVSCDVGMNGRTASTNIIQCRNDLRNKAAQMGATHVIVQHQQLGTGGVYIGGSNNHALSGCPNCITMVGTAYRD